MLLSNLTPFGLQKLCSLLTHDKSRSKLKCFPVKSAFSEKFLRKEKVAQNRKSCSKGAEKNLSRRLNFISNS